MTTWDEQEAAADRREAIENEAGERAAKHFESAESLDKAMSELLIEDSDALLLAEAVRTIWQADQSHYPTAVIEFKALKVLRKYTERVFALIAADEKAKIERGE